jgi:hypothetical protein
MLAKITWVFRATALTLMVWERSWVAPQDSVELLSLDSVVQKFVH